MPIRIGSAAFALGLMMYPAEALAQNAAQPSEREPLTEEGQEQRGRAGEQDAAPEQRDTTQLLPAIQGIEAAIRDLIAEESEIEREAERRRNADDLRAQQDMALWSFWTTLAAGASVFLTAVGVYLIWRTMRYTRDAALYAKTAADASVAMVDEAGKSTNAAAVAADAANDANRLNRQVFLADQRPWVAVECKLAKPLTWNVNGCNLSFIVAMKNTGRTPALNADIHFRAYSSYGVDHLKNQLALADTARKAPWVMGNTVFPGATVVQHRGTSISLENIIAANDAWVPQTEECRYWAAPIIIGCVQYRSVFGGIPHQAGFIYRVIRVVAVNDSVVISPSVGDIPVEHLALERWFEDGRVD